MQCDPEEYEMLITADGAILNAPNILHQNGVSYYWSGFLWTSSRVAGRSTIKYIADLVDREGSIPFKALRGSFFMAIRWPDGRVNVFADNSGMQAVYVSENTASANFVPHVEYLRAHTRLTLDREAAAHTYAIGRVLSGRTLIEQITRGDKYDFFELHKGRISSSPKGLRDIDAPDQEFDPPSFFDDLARALKRSSVSVALTGGYDSRMNFAFLNERIGVLPCLSGDRHDHPEVLTAMRVARQGGCELALLETKRPVVDDVTVKALFREFDGLCTFTDDSSFRLRDFYLQLAARGTEVHITGDGGVLHKDWEWMQDLPFYHKKNTNLLRFYGQRLAFNFDDRDAGPFLERELTSMRSRVVAQLESYVRATNTQSYDMLYYHVNGRRDTLYSVRIGGVDLYAPLMEKDFVGYSYGLPRRQRFFNFNMRRLTTQVDQSLAQIPTVYGMTASSKPRYVLRDSFYQSLDYGKKLIRMVGRSAFGKNLLVDSPTGWTIDADLRRLSASSEAVQFCRDAGIITESADTRSLSRPHLDRVIQIHMVADLAGITGADLAGITGSG